jgi:hypothetical protein
MHRELPLQQRLDAHRPQRVDGRLEIYQTNLLAVGSMFKFGRDKATEISRWQRSQALSMTADIDAKLPDRPSLEGYKIDALSLDSVAHLFTKLRKVP